MYKYVLQLFGLVSIGRVHVSSLATDEKHCSDLSYSDLQQR